MQTHSTIICLAFIAFACAGCDAERLRTSKQIEMIRLGKQTSVVHPMAAELLANSSDAMVTQNLNELVLTGALAPYNDSSLHDFDQINEIVLYCTSDTDQFLVLLHRLPNLKQLSICETDATDKGIHAVSQCKSLVGLGITSWCDVLSLDSINGLANVATLRQITLEIASSEHDLSKLQAALPDCKIFQTTYSKD